jgi:hypothetical protein
MAILYLDPENGNDLNGGTSFNVLAQGSTGRISGTTFSSVSHTFINDGSLIGQYLSIFNGSAYVYYVITAWLSSTQLTIQAISGGSALADQTVDRPFTIGGRLKTNASGLVASRIVPGDTIRLIGSPSPTSLGINGTWTSASQQPAVNVSTISSGSPISVTTSGAHLCSTGDTVIVYGALGNTAANGTWTVTVTGSTSFTLNGSISSGTYTGGAAIRKVNNAVVRLATPLTQNIACTGPNRTSWTSASASVTTSQNTTAFKEHSSSDSIAIVTPFTTGLAAYWTLPTTLDLSAYQQVSFWIQQTAGSIGGDGSVQLRLCSDTAGTTTVNTINIPATTLVTRWRPITVDLGTNLGSSIRSIAFFVQTNVGARTFLLNNIIACKAASAADSLTLTSLIGKNTTGETWWAIQSINGDRVMLDSDVNSTPTATNVRGYYGNTGTVTTWKRETIKIGPFVTGSTPGFTFPEDGIDGSPITLSGGWNRTNMSTQNTETWLDGVNGSGQMLTARTWCNISNIAVVRASVALAIPQSNYHVNNLIACNNNSGSFAAITYNNVQTSASYMTVGHMVANLAFAVLSSASPSAGRNNIDFTVDHGILSNGQGAFQHNQYGCPLVINKGSGLGLFANHTAALDIRAGHITYLNNLTFADNTSFDIPAGTNYRGVVYCKNCVISSIASLGFGNNTGIVYSHNENNVAGNHKLYYGGALISSATDERKTPSGVSWKIQVTNSSYISNFPIPFSLAKIACAANSAVTVKVWMRRNNTNLSMRLVCKGKQISGVESDVVSNMTAAVNTWAEQTITFTPTSVGVVEIIVEAWATNTTSSGWVDDLTISQT